MLKRAAICIALLAFALGSALPAYAYKNVAALIQLKAEDQHDTVGFNLVLQTNHFLYELLSDGRISLYAGPDHKEKISFTSLQTQEAQANIAFAAAQELFFYENWSSSSSVTNFQLLGISVVGRGKEKVLFGYLNAVEVEPYLKNGLVGINRNGSPGTTLWQAYRSRRYNYQLVQFGGDDFRTHPEQSIAVRQAAFGSSKKVEGLFQIPHKKQLHFKVKYEKYTTDVDESEKLFEALANFFHACPEFVLNHVHKSADTSATLPKKVNASDFIRLETSETWIVQGMDTLRQINEIKVFEKNYGIIAFSAADLAPYQVYVGFESMEEFIIRRNYPYRLTTLNELPVKNSEQDNIMEALSRYFWPQLTAYSEAK